MYWLVVIFLNCHLKDSYVLVRRFSDRFLRSSISLWSFLPGGILLRKGIVTRGQVTALSTVTVRVFLPCLIFASVIKQLDISAFPEWWILPLLGIAMPVLGLLLSGLLFVRGLPEKRNLLSLSAIQNAGYLVLPVGLRLFPERFEQFSLYCFLFMIGVNIVLWSIGKYLITSQSHASFSFRELMTPPVAVNVIAVLVVVSGLAGFVPILVLDAAGLLGEATVPVATFVLGATLGGIKFSRIREIGDMILVAAFKMMFMPVLVMGVLLVIGSDSIRPFLAHFLIIEAAVPPAAGLILQIRTYGGDEQKAGSIMLLCYLLCAFTLPLWVAIWGMIGY